MAETYFTTLSRPTTVSEEHLDWYLSEKTRKISFIIFEVNTDDYIEEPLSLNDMAGMWLSLENEESLEEEPTCDIDPVSKLWRVNFVLGRPVHPAKIARRALLTFIECDGYHNPPREYTCAMVAYRE